jgi:competence protein ComEC
LAGSSYIRGNRPGIEVGEDVVSPYLWSRGLKRIDVIALTHGHEDHLGGLPAVLRNFRVGQLWVGRDVDTANYRRLLAQANARGVPVLHRVSGEHFDWNGALIRVLWPDGGDGLKKALNDDSLVLRLVDGRESFLLTGDIERPVERGLLTQQAQDSQNEAAISADFLKVPHHGSKTSSTQPFLDAVHPRFAAISVGESNTFGQPNAEVIGRISAEGARVFRTDRDGAITAITDGNALSVRSFLDSQSPSPSPPPSSYRSSSITSPDTSSRSSAPAR